MTLQRILFAILLISLTTSKFIYNTPVNVSSTTVDFEYSPSQDFLFVSAENYLDIRGGIFPELMQRIQYPDTTFSALSFSQDDDFAISFTNGSTMIFRRRKSTDNVYMLKDEIMVDSEENENQTTIISLCFNADNTHLITASANKITVTDLEEVENNTKSINVDWEIKSVACSPKDTLEFTVGGSKNSLGVIMQYNFDYITGEIFLKHSYAEEDFGFNCLQYNSDGHFLYAVGQLQNLIMKYNTDDYSSENITFVSQRLSGSLTKIRINKKQDIIAVAGKDNVYTIQGTDNSTLEEVEAEQFASGIASVALSYEGGNLFVVDNTLRGSMKTQCDQGQFYDVDNSQCSTCDSTCGVCAHSASTCYECKDTYFVKNNTCTSCQARCKSCVSQTSCTQCLSPFIFKSSKCGCPDGKFIFNNACSSCSDNCITCNSKDLCIECKEGYYVDNRQCVQDGPSTWLIVVLVLLGVIVVAIVTFLVIKKIKQRKQSPLLQQEDGIEGQPY